MPFIKLTLLQKKNICQERLRRAKVGETTTIRALASWAKTNFKLHEAPSKAAISRIFSQSERLIKREDKRISKKVRDRPGKNHAVEKAVFTWICDRHAARININGDMIRAKATKLQELSKTKLPCEKQNNLKFCSGWLDRLKKRWGLRVFRSHGEYGDTYVNALERELPAIKHELMGYALTDIFNVDECGLFYCLAPSTTTAVERLPGRKKAKERIIFMPCANASGTEKIELMVIGNSVRPLCFKKKSGNELGFDYHANKNAWMTAALFFEWIKRFNDYIGRTPGRKAALLIDNCSTHGKAHKIPDLTNVKVVFLSPNCTSKIQPMDAGIIAALKLRYHRFHMERALDNVDADVKHIYKADVLMAMRLFKKAWSEIPASLIKNCWRHTGLLEKDEGATPESEIVDEVESARQNCRVVACLESAVNNLRCTTATSRVSIEDLLNPAGENDYCTQDVSDEGLVESIVEMAEDAIDSVEEDSVEVSLPTVKEQLKALAICKQVAEMFGGDAPAVLQWIRRNQASLRRNVTQSARQRAIDQFFN